MAGAVHIPWYATVFRGDQLAEAIEEIAPIALRYGATEWSIHRSRDDRYKFIQIANFEDKLDWQRYWDGPEFMRWRAVNSSRFQVPIIYVWHDIIGIGRIGSNGNGGNGGNGGSGGSDAPTPEPAAQTEG